MTHFDHRIREETARVSHQAAYCYRSVDTRASLLLPLLPLLLLTLLQPVLAQTTTGPTQTWLWKRQLGTRKRDCGVHAAFCGMFGWWGCEVPVAPKSTAGTGRNRNIGTGSLTLTTGMAIQRLQGGSFRTTVQQRKSDQKENEETATADAGTKTTISDDHTVVTTIRDQFQREVHEIMMGCRVELEEAFLKMKHDATTSSERPRIYPNQTIVPVGSYPTKRTKTLSNVESNLNENVEVNPTVTNDLDEVMDDTDTSFDDNNIAFKRNVIQRFFGRRISLNQKQKRFKEPLQSHQTTGMSEEREGDGYVDVGSMEPPKVVREVVLETGLEWNYHQDNDNEIVHGDHENVVSEQLPPSSLSATHQAILAAVRLLVKYAVLALVCLSSVWAGQIVASILCRKRVDTTASFRAHR